MRRLWAGDDGQARRLALTTTSWMVVGCDGERRGPASMAVPGAHPALVRRHQHGPVEFLSLVEKQGERADIRAAPKSSGPT